MVGTVVVVVVGTVVVVVGTVVVVVGTVVVVVGTVVVVVVGGPSRLVIRQKNHCAARSFSNEIPNVPATGGAEASSIGSLVSPSKLFQHCAETFRSVISRITMFPGDLPTAYSTWSRCESENVSDSPPPSIVKSNGPPPGGSVRFSIRM